MKGKPGKWDYRTCRHGEDANAIEQDATALCYHLEQTAVKRELLIIFDDGWRYIEPLPGTYTRAELGDILMLLGYRMKHHENQTPVDIKNLKEDGAIVAYLCELDDKNIGPRRQNKTPKAAPPVPGFDPNKYSGFIEKCIAKYEANKPTPQTTIKESIAKHKEKQQMYNILHFFTRLSTDEAARIALSALRDFLIEKGITSEALRRKLISRM